MSMQGFRYRLTMALLTSLFLLLAVSPLAAQIPPDGPDLSGGLLGKAPAAPAGKTAGDH